MPGAMSAAVAIDSVSLLSPARKRSAHARAIGSPPEAACDEPSCSCRHAPGFSVVGVAGIGGGWCSPVCAFLVRLSVGGGIQRWSPTPASASDARLHQLRVCPRQSWSFSATTVFRRRGDSRLGYLHARGT